MPIQVAGERGRGRGGGTGGDGEREKEGRRGGEGERERGREGKRGDMITNTVCLFCFFSSRLQVLLQFLFQQKKPIAVKKKTSLRYNKRREKGREEGGERRPIEEIERGWEGEGGVSQRESKVRERQD